MPIVMILFIALSFPVRRKTRDIPFSHGQFVFLIN